MGTDSSGLAPNWTDSALNTTGLALQAAGDAAAFLQRAPAELISSMGAA